MGKTSEAEEMGPVYRDVRKREADAARASKAAADKARSDALIASRKRNTPGLSRTFGSQNQGSSSPLSSSSTVIGSNPLSSSPNQILNPLSK